MVLHHIQWYCMVFNGFACHCVLFNGIVMELNVFSYSWYCIQCHVIAKYCNVYNVLCPLFHYIVCTCLLYTSDAADEL